MAAETVKRCLICYSKKCELLKCTSTTITNCSYVLEADDEHDKQQETFPNYTFILQKLLNIPVNRLDALQVIGGGGTDGGWDKPDSAWIHLCKQCGVAVGEAASIYKQLLLLTRQLKMVQKTITESLMSSHYCGSGGTKKMGTNKPSITDQCRKYFVEESLINKEQVPELGGFLVEELAGWDQWDDALKNLIKEESLESEDSDQDGYFDMAVVDLDTATSSNSNNMTPSPENLHEGDVVEDNDKIVAQTDEAVYSGDDDIRVEHDNSEDLDWEPEPDPPKAKSTARRKIKLGKKPEVVNESGHGSLSRRKRKVVVIAEEDEGERNQKKEKKKKKKAHCIVMAPEPEPLMELLKKGSDGKFHCSEEGCEKVYVRKYLLRNHIRSKHLGEVIYSCEVEGCGKTYSNANAFNAHKDRHNGTPRYKCDQCDMAFYAPNPFIRHKQKIHENGGQRKPFICEWCGKAFSCRDDLYNHKVLHRKKERTNKDRVICELCGKDFLSTTLPSHMKIMHEKVPGKWPCHLCEKRFHGKRHVEIHLYHHHGYGPESYRSKKQAKERFRCPVVGCKKKYWVKDTYDKHMLEQHGEDGEKPGVLRCKYCGKGYHVSTKLKQHELVHQNAETRPFKCDVCEKGFPTPSHLRFHKQYTHKLKLEDGRIHRIVRAKADRQRQAGTEAGVRIIKI